MSYLSPNWFIEGSVDFEHKKYILLSYLQQINQNFHTTRLYPHLHDLIFHYNNLLKFRNNKTILQNSFPHRLSHADLEALKLVYEKMVNDDALMQEIEMIINFALRKLDPALKEGKEIYEFVESHLSAETIGVIPLYPFQGYLLLRNGDDKSTQVYQFEVSIFQSEGRQDRGIHTAYLTRYPVNFIHTPEAIRAELIKTRHHYNTPAVYQIESDIQFPLEQTLLPLAKRRLLKIISNAA